jgi:hypothetical protein
MYEEDSQVPHLLAHRIDRSGGYKTWVATAKTPKISNSPRTRQHCSEKSVRTENGPLWRFKMTIPLILILQSC